MLRKYEKLMVFSMVSIMSVLTFANLGNRYMFIDESITAMLGRNILKFGYPKVWDGKNLIMASINGNEFNEGLVYIKHNWLPYYISAFGQLLGSDVVHIRALFVLIGIIGAIAFYMLVKRLTQSLKIALISLILYSFSVPIFLYIRSVYYLSPGLTFTILTILFYIQYMDKMKVGYLFAFVISAVLLFHSLYVFFFVTIITLISTYVIYDKRPDKKKGFLFSLISIAVFTLPWFIYTRRFLTKVQTGVFLGKIYFFEYLLGYIWQINTYFFPFISLGIIFLFYNIALKVQNRKKKKHRKYLDSTPKWVDINNLQLKNSKENNEILRRNRYIIVMQIIVNLLILSIFGNYLNTRWLIPSIPFYFIISATMISYISNQDNFIAIIVSFILLFTNIFHVSPYLLMKLSNINPQSIEVVVKPPVPFFNVDEGWKTEMADLRDYLDRYCYIRSYFLEYIEETLNDYDDAEEGMVRVLKKYGNMEDKVYLVGFQHETIVYYTNMQVVNRLDPDKQYLPLSYKEYPNAKRYSHLTHYPIEECDWIVIRKHDDKDELRKVKQIINDSEDFEEIYVDYPEADPWCEIWGHTFKTDSTIKGFYIYRNKKNNKTFGLQKVMDRNILEDKE